MIIDLDNKRYKWITKLDNQIIDIQDDKEKAESRACLFVEKMNRPDLVLVVEKISLAELKKIPVKDDVNDVISFIFRDSKCQ